MVHADCTVKKTVAVSRGMWIKEQPFCIVRKDTGVGTMAELYMTVLLERFPHMTNSG